MDTQTRRPPLETSLPSVEARDILLDGQGWPSGRNGSRRGRRSTYVTRNLTEGSIPRNLWFLAWPQVVEGAMRVMDQLADLVWAGHGIGTRAIAGMGVAQQYTQMAFLARQGIDTGMRAMVSRAVGMGNMQLANLVVLQAGTLTLAFALIMTVIGVLFTEAMLGLLGISDEVIAQGAAYMRIHFVGQAVTGFQNLGGHALAASGDTLTPMKANVVARVLHIVLSPLLMFGWIGLPALGLPGAAVANIIAHAVSLVLILAALFRGGSRLHLSMSGYRFDWPILRRLLKVGGPASVNSMERSIAQLILVGLVAPFGDYALAAYALTRRVEMFANLGSQGLGQASGIIVGQNLGAGKPERAKQTVLWAAGYVTVVKAILGAVLFAFPAAVLTIFSSDAELLAVAQIWLRIQVVGYVAMGIGQVAMQSFQTAGDTIVPMIVTLVSIWGIQQPLAFMLPNVAGLGQYGIAWAVVLAMAARPLFYIPYFFSGRWLRVRLLEESEGEGVGRGVRARTD